MEKQIIIDKSMLDKNKFKPIEDWILNKPSGGLWSSDYTPDEEYLSFWHEYSVKTYGDSNHDLEAVIFEFKDDARILTINSRDDWELAQRRFSKGRLFKTKHFSFEKASMYYDIIHVTANAVDTISDFWSYAIDSKIIMNFDCIKSWDSIMLSKNTQTA